ncbi:hypothetical protein HK104_001890 [Borealophlyctis nickersoniae]|nr:hypothetical protein HK104_001890 [Borealophlyctis nickersoniae]
MGATPVPHARTIRGGTSDDGRDSDGELGSGSDGNMRLQKAMEFQSDVKRQIEAVADADQRIRQKLEEIQRDTGTRCLYHKEKGAVLITANSVEHLEGAEYRIRQFENFILTRWPQPPPNPSGLSESASSFPPPPRPRPPSPSPTPAPLVHKRRFESDTSEYAKRARGIDGVIKIESAVPETPPPPPPPHQYTNLMDFAMALTLGTYRPDVEQIMQSDGEPPSGRHGTVSREVRSQAPTVVSMDKRPLPAASRSSSSPMTGLEQIVQSDGEEEDVPLDDPVARRRAARMEVCIHPPSMSVLEDRAGPFGKNGTASGEVRLLTPTVASMDKRPTPAALPSWSPITGLDPQEHFIQFPDDW